jgi:hypothetical protein
VRESLTQNLVKKYMHGCLNPKKARGDVMVESRGYNEDQDLQEEYEEFYLQ